jgi:hypothetical protein
MVLHIINVAIYYLNKKYVKIFEELCRYPALKEEVLPSV